MAYLLGCENIHLEYPSKVILDSVSIGINDGDRIGIVGRNGDGKSSLMAILAGAREADRGRVTSRTGTTIAMLGQMDTLDANATVSNQVVGDVDEHLWASDPRTREIIRGLMSDIDWHATVGSLSGGQRRRVDLARVLIGDHDVIMLDEPTNHLDVGAITWLADHLKSRWARRTGALLVTTHDRWFLDEVTTSTWEVHHGKVDQFEGGYAAYVLQRVEREAAAMVAEQKRQNLLRRELAWLSRGARARSTKPKFHVATAEALIAGEPPLRDTVELKRSAMSRLGKQVVDLENVSVELGGRTILDDVTWAIGPGDRFGILGPNGAGKTTLLNVIRGSFPPDSGRVRIGKTVKFAVLSQLLDELAPFENDRVRDVLNQYNTRYEIDGKELSPAQLLEKLGFSGSQLSAPVSELSGGQRRRLQLMLTLLDKPNVLILDEPDNDLDIDMLNVLENLLDTWPGTLLLITHDRYLMERVTDHQYALLGGKVRHVPGGVEEYLALCSDIGQTAATPDLARSGAGFGSSAAPSADTTPAGESTELDKPALSRADEYRLKKELASTERKLETATAKHATLQESLEAADQSDHLELERILSAISESASRVAELEHRWLELTERTN